MTPGEPRPRFAELRATHGAFAIAVTALSRRSRPALRNRPTTEASSGFSSTTGTASTTAWPGWSTSTSPRRPPCRGGPVAAGPRPRRQSGQLLHAGHPGRRRAVRPLTCMPGDRRVSVCRSRHSGGGRAVRTAAGTRSSGRRPPSRRVPAPPLSIQMALAVRGAEQTGAAACRGAGTESGAGQPAVEPLDPGPVIPVPVHRRQASDTSPGSPDNAVYYTRTDSFTAYDHGATSARLPCTSRPNMGRKSRSENAKPQVSDLR
jgi:hypothetical protein